MSEKKQKVKLTNAQLIAKKEGEIARIKEKERKLENGQKIILGGMLKVASKDPQQAKLTLELISRYVTKENDLKRLEPLITEFKKVVSDNSQQPQNGYNNQS